MAPFFSTLLPRGAAFDPSVPVGEFRDQWATSADVFSVLLILGGDVVARAIAQLAGSGVAPVAFSFGWVAYSIAALVSAVGENKLMPPDPDCRCKVIGGKTGHARDNSSWILGRVVRDTEYWVDARVRAKVDEVLEEKFSKMKKKDAGAVKPLIAGLVVSVYEPSKTVPAGTVARDASFWVGLPTIALQLAIASIACGVYGDWGTLLITLAGTVLSLATGLLPQWEREKWACRRGAKHDYILTRGNGSQHAILVLGNGHGLNLEDLGSGQVNAATAAGVATRVSLAVLAALWVLLLITAAGLQRQTWFLLAIGAIGILHNAYVAGAPRRPDSFGVPLDFVEVLGSASVMGALQEVETRYEGVGRAMLQEFFPGPIPDAEGRWWAERRVGAKGGLRLWRGGSASRSRRGVPFGVGEGNYGWRLA